MNLNAVEALKKWREENPEGIKQRTPLEKLKDKPDSLRLSVTAFCWSCVGGIKKEVTNCTAKECPLYNVRPWNKGQED